MLLLHLAENSTMTIGKLGTFDFPAGWYAYVGSAFGSGGLIGRIKYHLKPVERPHWHIDYFRQEALIGEIWISPDEEKHEPEWVEILLAIPGAMTPVEGFGSSDSRMESHLIYFDVRPLLDDFVVGVRARFPDVPVLRAFAREEDKPQSEASP